MSTAQQNAQNITTDMAQREPAGAGSLVVQGPIGADDWRALAQIANVIGNTEFVPKSLRGNKPGIMACLLYGRDQGVPAMIALSEISLIDGRPTMSAHLMAAKAKANGHKISRVEIRNDAGDIVGVTAKGVHRDGTTDEITWTLDDAKRAGLLEKANWKKYLRQMLWARAVSELCRTLFQDGFLGAVYTVDEVDETLDRHDEMDAEYAEVSAPIPQGTTPPGAGNGGNADAAGDDGGSPSPAATAQFVFTDGIYAGQTIDQVAATTPNYVLAYPNRENPDPATKAAVLDWLAEHPEVKPVPNPKPADRVEPEQTVIDA